jgi:hypothetical protein
VNAQLQRIREYENTRRLCLHYFGIDKLVHHSKTLSELGTFSSLLPHCTAHMNKSQQSVSDKAGEGVREGEREGVSEGVVYEHFMMIPYGEGENCLHTIKLVKNQEIIIGRNPATFSLDANHKNIGVISRRHMKILWKGCNEVFVTVLTSTPGMVSVNGVNLAVAIVSQEKVSAPAALATATVAHDGDNVSLMNIDKCFNYKLQGIRVVHEPPTEKTKPNEDEKLTSQPTAKASSSSSCDEGLVSKTECSICLLPLAFAHALHPCGHHFCYTCIFDWTKSNKVCPTCQSTISGTNPSHVLNDIIEGVLSNYDDKSILIDWKERLEEGIGRKKVDGDIAVTAIVAAASTPSPSTASSSINTQFHPLHPLHPAYSLASSSTSRKRSRETTTSSSSAKKSNNNKGSEAATTTVVDLTDHSSTTQFNTPTSGTVPQHCIAFHIQPNYDKVKVSEVGMRFKQILDNFDSNLTGLSNACWNPHRRCKHCRHLIAVDSFVVSSVGSPCFQKLFHVQCLSSYNRGLQFMGGGATDKLITFEKVVNVDFLGPNDVTQLRYNTVL